MSKTRQVQVFLTKRDEENFALEMSSRRPGIVYVDGNIWVSNCPPVFRLPIECKSNIIQIWDTHVVSELPCIKRADGFFVGPIVGVVVQFVRSRQSATGLLSGRLAASDVESEPMKSLVRDLWKSLRIVSGPPLSLIDSKTGRVIRETARDFIAGVDACAWTSESPENVLEDRAGGGVFIPHSVA